MKHASTTFMLLGELTTVKTNAPQIVSGVFGSSQKRHKYRIIVERDNVPQDIEFDFYGSIADCNSEYRNAYKDFQSYLSQNKSLLKVLIANWQGAQNQATKNYQDAISAMKAFYRSFPGYTRKDFVPFDFLKKARLSDFDLSKMDVPSPEPKYIDDDGLKFAFRCYITDALFALEYPDIDDFAQELGYKKVSEALRAHKECSKSLNYLKYHWSLTDNDLYTMLDELSAMGIE